MTKLTLKKEKEKDQINGDNIKAFGLPLLCCTAVANLVCAKFANQAHKLVTIIYPQKKQL